VVDYDLCTDEAEAASTAAALDAGDGIVLGLQWPDGLLPASQWAAFTEAKERHRERVRQAIENPPERAPFRRALAPFTGEMVDIELSEPTWLGR
jgi:hypothetical protein